MSLHKAIISTMVVVSILLFSIGSAFGMTYGTDRMPGDCPFSAMGASLCPMNLSAMAVHHVDTYNSYLNIPLGLATALVLLALAIFLTLHPEILDSGPPSFKKRSRPYIHPPSARFLSWLSLLEHSPSF